MVMYAHYPYCLLLKFVYSVTFISPNHYSIIEMWNIEELYNMSLTVSGKKYLSLFSTPMVLEHLFEFFST